MKAAQLISAYAVLLHAHATRNEQSTSTVVKVLSIKLLSCIQFLSHLQSCSCSWFTVDFTSFKTNLMWSCESEVK